MTNNKHREQDSYEAFQRRSRITLAILLITAVAGAFWFNKKYDIASKVKPKPMVINPYAKFENRTPRQILMIIRYCEQDMDLKCSLLGKRYLYSKFPNDEAFQTSLAEELLKQSMLSEAEQHFYDLAFRKSGYASSFGGYAKTLVALNRIPEAVKWYEHALSLAPMYVDMTEELSKLYRQLGRNSEAYELVKSYVEHYPNSAGYLSNELLLTKQAVGDKVSEKKIKLYSQKGLEFSIDVSLISNEKGQRYIVDTGANKTAIPKRDLDRVYPGAFDEGKDVKFIVANSMIEDGKLVVVPYLRVGPFELRNVEMISCERCQRLLGMNVLKRLKLKSSTVGQMSVMELRQ